MCPNCWHYGEVVHLEEVDCPKCHDRGYLPILRTPEQWVEAGGVLHDDMACWQIIDYGYPYTLHFLEAWGDLKEKPEGKIIIATPYITRKDLEASND
jgi:hypothetical protein